MTKPQTLFEKLPLEIIQRIGLYLDSDVDVTMLKGSCDFISHALSDKNFQTKRRLMAYGYVFPSLLVAITKGENDINVYRELMKHFSILPFWLDSDTFRLIRHLAAKRSTCFDTEVIELLDELLCQLHRGKMMLKNFNWTNCSLQVFREWLKQQRSDWPAFPCVRAALAMKALSIMALTPSTEIIDFRELYELLVSFSGVPRDEFMCLPYANILLSEVFNAKHFYGSVEMIADELIRLGEAAKITFACSHLQDKDRGIFMAKFRHLKKLYNVMNQISKDQK